MNKKEFNYLSSDGITQIHAIRWEPEGKQISLLSSGRIVKLRFCFS